ncbi:sarcosine oxidase subunit delta [Sphingosinicella soli]|uniref:Sarcosine oxidase subunit delta n=1 Tax=Sphingosinicella soli TaxID=333708 RepID=A0A7W7B474_9SPHN|nr:sarcosine oxidase subunit delta [Sphingosinicella soli]MBB4633714.1 sarcosine oxidase subunit delta [Sphingosinicella soli]
MLLIHCPHCGARDETEFVSGGEAHLKRPALDVSDAAWADYLFLRANPRGALNERWHHLYGCRRWFHVTRDTVSHAITAIYPIDETPAGKA